MKRPTEDSAFKSILSRLEFKSTRYPVWVPNSSDETSWLGSKTHTLSSRAKDPQELQSQARSAYPVGMDTNSVATRLGVKVCLRPSKEGSGFGSAREPLQSSSVQNLDLGLDTFSEEDFLELDLF